MATLVFGTRQLDLAEARRLLESFPQSVILHYDLAGDEQSAPAPHDGVHLLDFARLTFMFDRNGLTATEAQRLLAADREAHRLGLWRAVGKDADLAQLDLDESNADLDATVALYEHFMRVPGIRQAKASKLLHLKRPRLYPIVDSRYTGVRGKRGLYSSRAERAAADSPYAQARGWSAYYWKAIQEDLRTNADELERARQEAVANSYPLLQNLSRLRLHDIVAWSAAADAD